MRPVDDMAITNVFVFLWVCFLQTGQAFAFAVVPLHQPHTKAKALVTATYQKKFSIASQSAVPKPFNRPTTHRFYLHDYLIMSKGKDSTGNTNDTAPNVPPNNSTIAEFPTNDISLSFVLSTFQSSIKDLKDDIKDLKDDIKDDIKDLKDDIKDDIKDLKDDTNTRLDKLDGRIDGIYIFLIGFLATGFYAALAGIIRFFGPP
jgi:gas vesicle protein